jgi:hypothetical protein
MSIALATVFLASAAGHPQYVAMLPNGANVKGFAAIGHVAPAGKWRGEAFQGALRPP